jgi:hypothetical protein
VAEIAISLMLLIGAGLLIRSFVALNACPRFRSRQHHLVPPGNERPRLRWQWAAMTAYYLDLGAQLAAWPGPVARCGERLPFTSSIGWGGINVEGWTPEPGQELQVDQRNATSDYFSTMRIPLRKGRFFTNADLAPMPSRSRSSMKSSRSGSAGRRCVGQASLERP